MTAGVERIRKEIEGLEVGLLINCAGYTDGLRRFHEIDDEALRRLVKVNVEGLTKVCVDVSIKLYHISVRYKPGERPVSCLWPSYIPK